MFATTTRPAKNITITKDGAITVNLFPTSAEVILDGERAERFEGLVARERAIFHGKILAHQFGLSLNPFL